MAFALLQRSHNKIQGAATAVHKRKSALAQRSVGSWPGFERPVSLLHVTSLSVEPAIQTKLKIAEPNDKYEQEADRVADEVMRMPEPQALERAAICGSASPPRIQRVCRQCEEQLSTRLVGIQRTCLECEDELHLQPMEEEEEQTIQVKETPDLTPEDTPSVEAQINGLQGSGQPLPESVHAFFEPRFSFDFSSVRVDADFGAASATRQANARVFAVGRDIVFGTGPYAPETVAKKGFLAHELTDVVQQIRDPRQDSNRPTLAMGSNIAKRIERLEGRGQPLPCHARRFFEPRLGRDLSSVRVHSGSEVSGLAGSLKARAFTVGRNVVFGQDAYSPESAEGQRLLAHELVHVVQQTRAHRQMPEGHGAFIMRQGDEEGFTVTQSTRSQQTNTCGCNPPPTMMCHAVQHNMVLDAFRQAARWLDPAQRKMEAYLNAPANQRSGLPATDALWNHFRWRPGRRGGSLHSTPRIVLGVIQRLFTHIAQPICPNCQETCPCRGRRGWDVFACSINVWHNSNCYEFCERFFQRPGRLQENRLRAKIVLHEMMHSWEGMGDVAYEGDQNYPPNATIAQVNTDSYANLIRDLG